MGKFTFEKTKIPGVLIITPAVYSDERGFFMECYNERDFAEAGFIEKFVQDNHSYSSMGVVRGMHYQINPSPMGKLVSCIKGEIFDVGVDVRKGSPTFGKWFGDRLSDENLKMIYFPPGIAHGFLAIKDDTHVYYKCTGLYSKENERAIAWNDSAVKIQWPTEEITRVILSERDRLHPNLKNADLFV